MSGPLLAGTSAVPLPHGRPTLSRVVVVGTAMPTLLDIRTRTTREALETERGAPAPLHGVATAQVQLLGEAAALAEPLALPVEEVDRGDDHDRQARQDRRRVLQLVLAADVLVDFIFFPARARVALALFLSFQLRGGERGK